MKNSKQAKRTYLGHTFSNKNMPVRSGELKPMKGTKPLKPWNFPKRNPSIPSNAIVFYDAAVFGDRTFTQAILTRNDLNAGNSQVDPETKKRISLPINHSAEQVPVLSGKRVLGHAVIPVVAM